MATYQPLHGRAAAAASTPTGATTSSSSGTSASTSTGSVLSSNVEGVAMSLLATNRAVSEADAGATLASASPSSKFRHVHNATGTVTGGVGGAPTSSTMMSRAATFGDTNADAISAYGGSLVCPCADAEVRGPGARGLKRACASTCCAHCLTACAVQRAGRSSACCAGVCVTLYAAEFARIGAAYMASTFTSPARLVNAAVDYFSTGACPVLGNVGGAIGLHALSCVLFAAAGAAVNSVNSEWGGDSNVTRYCVGLGCMPACFAYSFSRAVDRRNEETGASTPLC